MLYQPAFRWAAWAGVIALGLGALAEAVEQDWSGVVFFVGFGAGVVLLLATAGLPPLLGFALVAAALLSAVGWTWDAARRFAPYDQLNHAFTIFAVTESVGYRLYGGVRDSYRAHPWLFASTIACFGIAVGALWEIFEWSLGVLGSRRDVVLDLIADSVGALAAAGIAAWALRA